MNGDDTEDVLGLIDRGTWKHSWHLNKNRYGYVDWNDKENIEKCLEIANDAIKESQALGVIAQNCRSILMHAKTAVLEQERIDEGME